MWLRTMVAAQLLFIAVNFVRTTQWMEDHAAALGNRPKRPSST
jgi:hypothetical protein